MGCTCASFSAGLLLVLGITSVILGPLFILGIIIPADEGGLMFGIIFLAVGTVMTLMGICLAWIARKSAEVDRETAQRMAEQQGQPLVSGCTPPGPVSGFHVQVTQQNQQPQPSGPAQNYRPQPSAPTSVLLPPNQPPPPSYSQVTGKY